MTLRLSCEVSDANIRDGRTQTKRPKLARSLQGIRYTECGEQNASLTPRLVLCMSSNMFS